MGEHHDVNGVNVGHDSAKDIGECCEQCQKDPTCGWFTYLPGGWGCDVGCCYRKSPDGFKGFNASCSDCISGYVPGGGTYTSGAVVSGGKHGGSTVPVGTADQSWKYGRFCVRAKLPGVEAQPVDARPQNCSMLMESTDVLGGGGAGQASAADVGQCCDLCRKNSLCSYFTYMKRAWGCDGGCCYMKTASGGFGGGGFNTSAPGRVSGFMPGGSDKSLGIWPAHWMMPDVDDCWPSKGEIDIMEMVNGDGIPHGTYHWTGDGQCGADAANGGQGPMLTDWATAYHEFALEWAEDHMFFVVDGKVIKTVLPGYPATYGGPTKTTFYDVPYYWLLNTAVGEWGAWAGPPGPDTVFPV